MAKRPVPDSAPQEEEMIAFVFKFKGSGETLRRGMDTVSQAIAGLGPGAVQTVTRTVGNGRKAAPQLGAAPPDLDAEAVDDADTDEADAADAETPTAAPSAPKAPATRRKHEFNSKVSDNAAVQLKDFVAERKPVDINDRYLVACLWLQTVAGFDVFTAEDVWSCFQMMDWKKLADFTQPMRLMKSKKSYFDMPKKGEWKLNPHGLAVAQAIKPATA